MWPQEFLVLLFMIGPFLLYYSLKWTWRILWRNEMIPLPIASSLRHGNQVFQIMLAMLFLAVLIADYQAQTYLEVTTTCFWLGYFLWPVSSAIYENSQKTNREFAIYWVSSICVALVLYYWFAIHAE